MPRAPEDWRRTIHVAKTQVRQGETDAAIATLLPALRWRYDTARNGAVELFASVGKRAEGPLLQTLRSAETAVERRAAADALGLMESRRAVSPLLHALEDPNMVVRRSASLALLRLQAREAVPPILRLLRDDSGGVRVLAANVLGRFADSSAVPGLIRALGDAKWYVRQAAAEALGELGDPTAVAALTRALRDRRPAVVNAARRALAACVESQ